jgi:hypothetical protein
MEEWNDSQWSLTFNEELQEDAVLWNVGPCSSIQVHKHSGEIRTLQVEAKQETTKEQAESKVSFSAYS